MVLLTTKVVPTGEISATELVKYITCYLVTSGQVLNVFFTCIVIYTSWVLKLHMELRYVTRLPMLSIPAGANWWYLRPCGSEMINKAC